MAEARDGSDAEELASLQVPPLPPPPPSPPYENSHLDTCVYELHVWLLAADRRSIIAQHHVAPRTSGRDPRGCWLQVSHVFRHYGSGVRFVHFLHKTKNRMEPAGLLRTRVTDSSVSVQLRE
ncbi:PREDICTED: F-box only protein 50 [Condylura cristata]|uniref:F-box only protein 50 n=1 Tax=Condylura cristata TaxID=143302 RepID=UPI000642EF78|nr:PREDICTED: F-box only protein 50 [Condylura cristata]